MPEDKATEKAPIWNWHCYADLDKSNKKGRERYEYEYIKHDDGTKTAVDCSCGGVGYHTTRNICVHMAYAEYRTRCNLNAKREDDPEEWEVEYYG